ncbi:MAG: hypothetical protein R3D81_05245 [Thalassovita sp.]
MRHLRQEATPGRVHIATLPALAQLWLAPRLPGLRAALPDMEISITALETPPNLKRVPFDLCLFYANHNGATPLCDDHILPVCTRNWPTTCTTRAIWRRRPALTDATWAGDWEIWAERALPDHAFTPPARCFRSCACGPRGAGRCGCVDRAAGACGPASGQRCLGRAFCHLCPGTRAHRRMVIAGQHQQPNRHCP